MQAQHLFLPLPTISSDLPQTNNGQCRAICQSNTLFLEAVQRLLTNDFA
jgi:hypothetical protein